MNNFLLPVLYAAPIDYYAVLIQDNQIQLEKHENFVKSTYRNRMIIAGPNGPLMLSIPIKGGKSKRQKYGDVEIDNTELWQKNHWQGLTSSYRSSPYFEFYEDDLKGYYTEKADKLYDFNLKLFDFFLQNLGIKPNVDYTKVYQKDFHGVDCRKQFKNRQLTGYEPYIQVFKGKNGFIPGLSIYDLLFNLGPESINYLKTKSLLQTIN